MPNNYNPVDASPVKRFFVEMLTRDIDLEDAILDLLDNCVDGILRSIGEEPRNAEEPYAGFWAKIKITEELFEIEDNCGGIPWRLHHKAFRMGRPTDEEGDEIPGGVGAYGIGMKRAIFKMGRDALIWTKNDNDAYGVVVSPEWLDDQENWELEVRSEQRDDRNENGTMIMVQELYEYVSERFRAENFVVELRKKISQHYAIILTKGFSVEVNEVPAKPKGIEFRMDVVENNTRVMPYIFETTTQDGVDIFLVVGLRDPVPSVERMLEEQENVKYSSDRAGWTIICNDRVVLYCDRSELTGWGLYGIPKYHTQFSAITGIVEFRGDPKLLPTTTTKRGLNFSSSTYQKVLVKMQEGMRMFVDFTNRWKTLEKEARELVASVPTLTYPQVRVESKNLKLNATRNIEGKQFKPNLPSPPTTKSDVRISYLRSQKQVQDLAYEMLEDTDDYRAKDIPKEVGKRSFEFAYTHFVGDDSVND